MIILITGASHTGKKLLLRKHYGRPRVGWRLYIGDGAQGMYQCMEERMQ